MIIISRNDPIFEISKFDNVLSRKELRNLLNDFHLGTYFQNQLCLVVDTAELAAEAWPHLS